MLIKSNFMSLSGLEPQNGCKVSVFSPRTQEKGAEIHHVP